VADRDLVYFRGEPLPEACSLRKLYGLPCPTCGMTRGLVLAVHGKLADSVSTNAAAPVLAGIGLALGLLLAGSGGLRLAGRERAAARLARWARLIGLAGAGAWPAVLAANWIAALWHLGK
jgi:hypothetical protein